MTKQEYIRILNQVAAAFDKEIQAAIDRGDDFAEGLAKGNQQALLHAATIAQDLEPNNE